jgi:hypothetical protein
MIEVLDRFNEWSTPIQDAFIILLSASSVPLAYFEGEVDVGTSIPARTDSRDVHLTMNVTTTNRSKSNNAIIVSHNASELEDIRISQLKSQMAVEITLINTGEHPLYKMQLSSKDNIYNVEQTMRFAQYRDFQQNIMDKCSLKMCSEFPDTKTRSSLGLKLNDEELKERARKLNKVCI